MKGCLNLLILAIVPGFSLLINLGREISVKIITKFLTTTKGNIGKGRRARGKRQGMTSPTEARSSLRPKQDRKGVLYRNKDKYRTRKE